jgi:Flp pilus assembly protein TadD
MSLIIDALKKAQELHSKELRGTPPPTDSTDRKKSPRSLGKRWIFISMGLASLIFFLLVLWNSAFSPSSSTPIQSAVHLEKRPSVPIEKEKTREPSKDIMNLTKDVLSLPKDIISLAKFNVNVSKTGLSLESNERPKQEKFESNPLSSKREESFTKPMAIQPLPAPLDEKTPSKMIEVRQESDKDRPFTSEIIKHFNLGIQFNNQREFSKAIQAYQKVIELDPTYIEAYNNLGIIYQEMGDMDKAFEAYQKSIEINPQYEKGYNNLGILYYLRGRNEEAMEAFQKALAINSNNIVSHLNLGVLHKKQGQLNKAIESYQKALDINPLLREVHYNIALLYEQSDHIEWAIVHYQQFIKLSSESQSDLVLKVERHLNDLMKIKEKKK